MGRSLHVKLKASHERWRVSGSDTTLLEEILMLADQFGKQRMSDGDGDIKRLCREDLELICFEYVSG